MKIKGKKHPKNKILTSCELSRKTHMLSESYTKEERLEDTLIDILGFLKATKAGHKYRYGIDGAIAKIAKTIGSEKKSKKIA